MPTGPNLEVEGAVDLVLFRAVDGGEMVCVGCVLSFMSHESLIPVPFHACIHASIHVFIDGGSSPPCGCAV
jgi:hypothetical protein